MHVMHIEWEDEQSEVHFSMRVVPRDKNRFPAPENMMFSGAFSCTRWERFVWQGQAVCSVITRAGRRKARILQEVEEWNL